MKMTFIAAMILGIAISAPASARNYDCSKAGNANKAVCKSAATLTTKTTVKAASKAMPATKVDKMSALYIFPFIINDCIKCVLYSFKVFIKFI